MSNWNENGGNKGKGIRSRKGGNNKQQPILDSVNAPKTEVNMQPFMQPVAGPTEQIKSNEDVAAARKTYLESDDGKAAKEAADKNAGFLKYEGKEWNQADAEAALKKDETFADILRKGQAQADEYKERMETAKRTSKYNALGNLLVSLGQIAGGGKSTYVKPTTGRYLTESMAKADEARRMYDAAVANKDAAESKYRSEYMNRSQQAHAQAEKLREQAYNNYNKVVQKEGEAAAKLELDRMYKEGLLSLRQYANETARLQYNLSADKEKRSKYPMSYVDADTGTQYNLDNSTIKRIAAIMRDSGDYKGQDLLNINALLSSDKDLDFTKEANLDIMVQDFIRKNLYKNNELDKLISTVNREKVKSTALPPKYNF